MPMPYYVSPEQMMQDKAEYAKKGIAKGLFQVREQVSMSGEPQCVAIQNLRDL